MFHRTLSAERRTVKLVFFFRLPTSMKAAIEVDHVDPKNTLVGEQEKQVKVKEEKEEQSSSTEGTTSGTTPADDPEQPKLPPAWPVPKSLKKPQAAATSKKLSKN